MPQRSVHRCSVRGDVGYLVRIEQTRNDLLDLFVLGRHQVKPAGKKMDARVDRRRSVHDLVDAGMRARDHDDHTVGRIERERQFTQFERTRLVGDQCNQMDARRDLDVLVDELEIGDGPGGAEPHHVGGHAVVVPCSGGSEASLR